MLPGIALIRAQAGRLGERLVADLAVRHHRPALSARQAGAAQLVAVQIAQRTAFAHSDPRTAATPASVLGTRPKANTATRRFAAPCTGPQLSSTFRL